MGLLRLFVPVYSSLARPFWDSCDRVDVRSACSAEALAHVYLRVPWGRGARSLLVLQVPGEELVRQAADGRVHILDWYAYGRIQVMGKTPSALVIGVPLRTRGLSASAIGNPPRRIARRPLSLCGQVDASNSGGSSGPRT